MKALHWDGSVLRLEGDYPQPDLKDGWVRVRMILAGICSTDLQILQGYMGFQGVPGHEAVGVVEDGPESWVGQRVVCDINFACRACSACEGGLHRHCPNRTVLGILGQDGAFAESFVAPIANLHAVPDSVSDTQAVFAEPLAAAFAILEQVDVAPGHEVLVLGDGKLGLLCAQALHTTGAEVTLVGKHSDKLAVASARGVKTQLLSEFEAKKTADVVVEATGSESGLALGLQAVRPRGTLVLKSTVAAEHTLSLASLVIDEVRVIGSRCGLFPVSLEALETGSVDVESLVQGTFDLEHGEQAVARAKQPGTLKILLRP